jgi:poly(hydroxyalkanoate) granule-associated protein
MAKPKLKKKATTAKPSAPEKSRKLLESAQQIWMAGLGAFGRAQEEGTKLFEGLVREGMALEQKTRSFATGKVDVARDAVESTVATVRGRAADTWDRLEKVFEDRVSRALGKLGVPGRDEMQALLDRVEDLNRAVRKLNARPEPAQAKAKAPRTVRSSVNKAMQGVALMAEAAGDAQAAAAKAAKSAVKKATKALK